MKSLIQKYKEDIVKDTQAILRIRSVEGEAVGNMPFGEDVQRALETSLGMCEKLGMKTDNIDNYAGHAEIGEGDQVIGILCHLDVVPEGQDWDYDPFGAVIEDGRIYARGALDDKGPAVAAAYAMKIVEEMGTKLDKKVRIIFGTNEETGSKGIEYYLEKIKAPDMAFTPDADFPVIHGEKGILLFELESKLGKKGFIKSIKGGNAPNMVCDLAEIEFSTYDEKIEKLLLEKQEEFEKSTGCRFIIEKDGGFRLKSKGKSAHGSTPENGINAISGLMLFVNDTLKDVLDCGFGRYFDFYSKHIGLDYNGQSIGCGFEDEQSGKLIFNVGMIESDEDSIKTKVNVRYPISSSRQEIYESMGQILSPFGVELSHMDESAPIYLPKDNKLVQSLIKVYKEVTGDMDAEPIVIGGGTYARSMKNAVAFGPLFADQEDVMHQKNEYISIDQLLMLVEMYAKAIIELLK